MEAQETRKFDTGAYESALVDAGEPPEIAQAHRKQLVLVVDSATKDLVTKTEAAMSETRLELAMQKVAADLTWRILGGVALIVTIATAIVKLT